MKLRYHPDSPFVRKVLIVASEVGLFDQIELVSAAAHPVQRDMSVVPENPLGQVPVLKTDDGLYLSDSRVICEYLDGLAGGGVFPEPGNARWRALSNQSLADGLILSAVQARYEILIRPEAKQWGGWHRAHLDKMTSVIAHFEAHVPADSDKPDIGALTLACGLAYLDHRYKDMDWRSGALSVSAWFEQISLRPSMQHIRLGSDLKQES